jgi:hypothetical protein
MNFEFGNYNARLTFNPADVTIRMENRENKRLYETIFVAEDFEGLSAIGGLTTLENILKTGFEDDDSNATINVVEEKIDYICLKVEVKGLIPVSWTIRVDARRRESSDTAVEVEELREKIKELEETVNYLHKRCSLDILIPGCPVISWTLDKINFVENMTTDTLPITCPHNCAHKIIKADRLSTYNNANQQICCAAGHWAPWPFKEFIKYVCPPLYDFETNTYTIKDPEDINIAYENHPEAINHLEEISITHSKKLSLCFVNQYKLKKLILHCPNLSDEQFEILENCKTLEEIDLEGCSKLTTVNMLAKLPALTKLNIKGTAVKNTTALTNSRLMIEK